jgi:hypothetical protein
MRTLSERGQREVGHSLKDALARLRRRRAAIREQLGALEAEDSDLKDLFRLAPSSQVYEDAADGILQPTDIETPPEGAKRSVQVCAPQHAALISSATAARGEDRSRSDGSRRAAEPGRGCAVTDWGGFTTRCRICRANPVAAEGLCAPCLSDRLAAAAVQLPHHRRPLASPYGPRPGEPRPPPLKPGPPPVIGRGKELTKRGPAARPMHYGKRTKGRAEA